jgi:hypothetical protein
VWLEMLEVCGFTDWALPWGKRSPLSVKRFNDNNGDSSRGIPVLGLWVRDKTRNYNHGGTETRRLHGENLFEEKATAKARSSTQRKRGSGGIRGGLGNRVIWQRKAKPRATAKPFDRKVRQGRKENWEMGNWVIGNQGQQAKMEESWRLQIRFSLVTS